MTFDAKEIADILPETQRRCIVALSSEWSEQGYNKVDADILYALGGSDLYGCYGPLVDCDFHRPEGRGPNYRHRLLPLGMEVKAQLFESVT